MPFVPPVTSAVLAVRDHSDDEGGGGAENSPPEACAIGKMDASTRSDLARAVMAFMDLFVQDRGT